MTTALVVGGSREVWQEVLEAHVLMNKAFPGAAAFDAYYLVKRAGIGWKGGRFTWVTLHPEFMDKYEAERAALGLDTDYEIVSSLEHESGAEHKGKGRVTRRMSYRFTGMDSSASSAGFACKVALEDGHDRIVLAGAPLVDAAGHFSRGAWLTELGIPAGADQFKIGFEKSIPFFAGRVRSLSGWTKEKLGEPSPEWLAQAAVRKGTQA